ncbi:uncharacterized protein LOC125479040 [Pyrus x bretschneideri]|uniref:uncharacterized protein LOC125479040 n=1 Tax=Pyrus x bretschneideri TaxID=225117 RepID=UPI0020307CBB|nr:uncharacterized protein LOC125479040 [Pyrus x bretschneideri]
MIFSQGWWYLYFGEDLSVARKLSGKVFLEAANHQLKRDFVRKGFAGATSRYLGLRSVMALLGPVSVSLARIGYRLIAERLYCLRRCILFDIHQIVPEHEMDPKQHSHRR